MRVLVIYWIVIFLIFLAFSFFIKDFKFPPIQLPRSAQHNTLGELPVVEVMDDGDYYERDGEENFSCYERWVERITEVCRNKESIIERRSCIEASEDVLKNLIDCTPRCQDLSKIGSFWTCWHEKNGGGLIWK
ncbi:MAG TPA: hypothetical protein V6D12_14015 [Candidatus Obscuribacterales bacterium]